MDAVRLKDIVARGLGTAAQKLGSIFVVFRPAGNADPLSEKNRVIRLFAAFEPESGEPKRQTGPVWRGIFDSAYTRPGDYLVGEQQTFFIACQATALPAECVLINRVVSIVRPMASGQAGYSGLFASSAGSILSGWPVNVTSSAGGSALGLAGRGRFGRSIMLFPPCSISVCTDDVVSDDAGYSFVVEQAEANPLGWRMTLKQVGP